MIEIDFMTEADIDAVLEVENKCFLKPWSRNAFLGDLLDEHTVYLVAKADGKIIGYVGGWCVLEDADITNIAVLPEYRRQGIGKMLLKRLIIETKKRGSQNIRLEVRESNISAISLYEKFEFIKIYTREKYYENHEDALIMEKKVTK